MSKRLLLAGAAVGLSLGLPFLFSAPSEARTGCRDPIQIDREVHRQDFHNDRRQAVVTYRVVGTLETCERGRFRGGFRQRDERSCHMVVLTRQLVRTVEYRISGGQMQRLAQANSAYENVPASMDYDCNRAIETGKQTSLIGQAVGSRDTWSAVIMRDLSEVRRSLELIDTVQ